MSSSLLRRDRKGQTERKTERQTERKTDCSLTSNPRLCATFLDDFRWTLHHDLKVLLDEWILFTLPNVVSNTEFILFTFPVFNTRKKRQRVRERESEN